MNQTTPLRPHPKKEILAFLRTFARTYCPTEENEVPDEDTDKPHPAFPALC